MLLQNIALYVGLSNAFVHNTKQSTIYCISSKHNTELSQHRLYYSMYDYLDKAQTFQERKILFHCCCSSYSSVSFFLDNQCLCLYGQKFTLACAKQGNLVLKCINLDGKLN